MFFILPCQSCGKKLRFPLDRGKIRVTCTCGSSFIADPDDTSLYKRGSFDVGSQKQKISLYQRIRQAAGNLSGRDISEQVIKKLVDFKYRLQNFRLLPAAEQKKLLVRLLLVVMVVTLLLFFYIAAGRSSSPGSNVI